MSDETSAADQRSSDEPPPEERGTNDEPVTKARKTKEDARDPLWRRVYAWLVLDEGSPRPMAIVRIATVCLVWAEYAQKFAWFNDMRPGRFLVSLSLYGSMTLTLLGYKTRMAVSWLALTLILIWFYAGRHLRSFDYSHHHTWLLLWMTVLLAFTSCGRSYSLDRFLALRRESNGGPEAPPERGPLWAQRLMTLQMSAVYFWAVLDKTTPEFLSGDRLEQIVMFFYTGSDWIDGPLARLMLSMAAIAVVASEFFLAFGLFVTRWHRWLIPLAILLHWSMFVLVPVWIFSAQMTVYLLAFMPPERVHRFLDTFNGFDQKAPERAS